MATITVDLFDPKSIEKAVTRISVLKTQVERFKELPVKELADYGLSVAQDGFASALTVPWYSDHPVTVSLQETEKGYCICAVGEQVSFIEFGAGVHKNSTPYPGNVPDWVVPWGEFGYHKGRQIAWSYIDYINGKIVGRTTEGITARHGMYRALQTMKNLAPAALKKYFNSAFKGL